MDTRSTMQCQAHIKAREDAAARQSLRQIIGIWARNGLPRRAALIAMRMGLTYVRTLTVGDLVSLVQSADLSGMEISYTANRQDTRRAIRNTGFLTRFTGQPSRPAIASVRNDPEIAHAIAGGLVHWHEIPERDLEPG